MKQTNNKPDKIALVKIFSVFVSITDCNKIRFYRYESGILTHNTHNVIKYIVNEFNISSYSIDCNLFYVWYPIMNTNNHNNNDTNNNMAMIILK